MKPVLIAFSYLNRIYNSLTCRLHSPLLLPPAPFCIAPTATVDYFHKTHVKVASVPASPALVNLESFTGHKIDLEWLDRLALHTQICCKAGEQSYFHGRVLYSTLSSYIERLSSPDQHLFILETGTARGFSAVCMSKALDDRCQNASILSLDIIPPNKAIYWNCLTDHTRSRLTRSQLLSDYPTCLNRLITIQGYTSYQLDRLNLERIHFGFLDASHTYADVMHEYRFIAERQLPGDIIIFDDVNPTAFPGVYKAVLKIESSMQYHIQFVDLTPTRSMAIGTKL